MHNIKKNILLNVIALWLSIISAPTYGQAKFIGRDFINYCEAVPWEDIFIHTDREWYVSGENLWLSVYAFDRKSMHPSTMSKIAYVELLNYDNRPVIRQRILLTEGNGPGQFNLPDTLSSGIYTLRAYTSWMKNFLPDGCFVKEIGIYNALNNQPMVKRPVKSPGINLPKSIDVPGFRLMADNSEADVLKLSIETTADFRNMVSPVCNLLIHTRGNINHSESIPLSGNVIEREINGNSLMPGINNISAFDAQGRLIKQVYIYTAPRTAGKTEFDADSSFGTRDKISLKLILSGDPELKTASISVAPVAVSQFEGLDDFLIFGTEFGNDISSYANSDLSSLPPDSLEMLLAGLESKWINWDVIAGNDSLYIRYLPETKEHFITGTLVNGKREDDYVILSQPGKNAFFNYSSTDKLGKFSFSLPVDGERKELIIQPDDMQGTISIGSSFSDEFPVTRAVEYAIPEFVPALSVNYQVGKIYNIAASQRLPSPPVQSGTGRFYGKPDMELILSDYIKLPLMEEIFFELLPGTYMKKRRSDYELYVTDPVTEARYDYPTTLFVDGVRIDDANAVAAIDPELVERIDVLRERYMVGDYLFHGIVNIITKAGDFTSVPLPDYAVRTFYQVIDPLEKFIAPDYGTEAQKLSRIPDFRNTLWWEAVTSKPSEFWSSDVPGKYRILLNGIRNDGTPVSAEKIIVVH